MVVDAPGTVAAAFACFVAHSGPARPDGSQNDHAYSSRWYVHRYLQREWRDVGTATPGRRGYHNSVLLRPASDTP